MALTLNEAQDQVSELAQDATAIELDLSNAESCETLADFETNLEEALSKTSDLLGELRKIAKATIVENDEDE